MSLKIFITLFCISTSAIAQQPPPAPADAAAAAPAPAPGAVTPAPAPANPPASPPAVPAGGTPPPAAAAETLPPLDPANPPAVLAPLNAEPNMPSLVTPGADKKGANEPEVNASKPSVKEIEMNSTLRNKSPFMIPTDLYLKIKRRMGEKVVEKVIDDSVGPKLRWPLRSYSLVGIYAGVKIPKALIVDKEGKIHTFRTKELIANSGGYISEIGNGEVIVVERGAEIKLTLKKDSKN